jgi:hypothetical protein
MFAHVHENAKSPLFFLSLKRASIFLVIGSLCMISIFHTLSCIITQSAPDLAVRTWSNNAIALNIRTEKFLKNPKKDPHGYTSISLARRSLLVQATNGRALRNLAIALFRNGKSLSEATKVMRLSDDLTRLDIAAQLWLIKDAALNQDIKAVLKRYDTILLTSYEGRNLLFPMLASALSDPEFRKSFHPYMSSSNVWLPAFVTYVVQGAKSPDGLADLVVESKGLPHGSIFRVMETQILERLIAFGQFDRARRMYISLSDAKPSILSSINFTDSNIRSNHEVMAWQLSNTPEISSIWVFNSKSKQNQLIVDAMASAPQVVIRKLLFHSPGRVNFKSRLSASGIQAGADIFWQIQCLHNGRSDIIWTSKSFTAGISFLIDEVFIIPDSCPHQYVSLVVKGGSDSEHLILTLDKTNLFISSESI